MHSAKQNDRSITPEHEDVSEQSSGIRTWSAAQSLSLQEPEETVELVVPGMDDHLALVVLTTDRLCRRLGANERFKHEAVLGVREAFSGMARGVLCASEAEYITLFFHLLADGLLIVMIAHGHDTPVQVPLYELAMSGFILRSCMDEVELSQASPSRLCLYKKLTRQTQPERNALQRGVARLRELGAPRQMCAWMTQQADLRQAWRDCPQPLWLLLLSEVLGVSRKQQVAAVARCIEVPQSRLGQKGGAAQEPCAAVVIEALDSVQLSGELPIAVADALRALVDDTRAPEGASLADGVLAGAVLRLDRALQHADRASGVAYAAAVLQWALAQTSEQRDPSAWCVHVIRSMLSPAGVA